MTTKTAINLYGRYLDWHQSGPIKDLKEITLSDAIQIHEDETETAHDLETERQVDFDLIRAENN